MRLAAVAALLVGCGSSITDRNLVVTSGRLTYEATLDAVDSKEEIDWDNSGTQAVIDWTGTALTAGSVVLQLTDGAGAGMYDEAAEPGKLPDVTVTRGPGKNLGWKAVILFRGASGKVKLDVQGAR